MLQIFALADVHTMTPMCRLQRARLDPYFSIPIFQVGEATHRDSPMVLAPASKRCRATKQPLSQHQTQIQISPHTPHE